MCPWHANVGGSVHMPEEVLLTQIVACSNAVNRVLNRLDGVKDVQISLPEQSVKVKAGDNVTYDKVLETIKKTGKTVNDGKTVA
jgi:copper chaperone